MEHLDTFLGTHPPFDALTGEQRRELAGAATIAEHPAGEMVLVEDAPPAAGMWILLAGSVELLHQGEVIQVLEPGECFGHISLLTAMPPAFGVRAREPSRTARLGAAAARWALATEAGVAYVAGTMRTRLTRTGQTVHGLADVGTTPVSAIMRPPAFADADQTLAVAARRLGEEGAALLVDLGGELGIVADADVRAAIARDPALLDAPLRRIARHPAPAVPVSELAIEATVEMLAADAQHLAVLDGDRVCGLVSATDLLGLDAQSPIGLRHTILGAADEDGLARSVAHLPGLFLALVRGGVPSRDLGRVLSLAQDAVVARLIDFSVWGHGAAPVPWAWLDLGSAARREFTLASDQDNALVYDTPAAGRERETDEYFARLGADVNDGLARCGIGVDNNGVLAGDRRWRMSRRAWLRTFAECLTEPDESHLVRATVGFDFRPTSGGLEVAPELAATVRAAREYPQFMRLMARSAAGFPVALGFRGQLSTDGDGRLDIKRGGIIPLVNLVRYHALSSGVTISPTLDRIEAVAGVGGIEREQADALREAFGVITRARFEHHAGLIAAGRPADNQLAPGELPPIARQDLRDALQTVRRAQRRLPV